VAVLPSRGADRPRLERTALSAARAYAASVHATLEVQSAPQSSAAELTAARQALMAGSFDDAVRRFDHALEAAAEAPDRVGDWSALLSAQVTRASLAMARGEMGRARSLISRALRYDPSFHLAAGERNPQMQAIVDDLRPQLAVDRPVEAAELGGVCSRADVVLVGRSVDAERMQVLRFDRCKEVARAFLRYDGATDELVQAMRSVPLADTRPAAAATTATPRSTSDRGDGRGLRIGGGVAIGLGLALLVPGIYFAVDSDQRKNGLADGCTPATPCAGSLVHERKDAYTRSAAIGGTLTALGLGAALVGVVVEVIGVRRGHATERARAMTFPVPIAGGATWTWRTTF
jgi:hypothetical protein